MCWHQKHWWGHFCHWNSCGRFTVPAGPSQGSAGPVTSAVPEQVQDAEPHRYRMLFLHINTWEDFGGNFYQISLFHPRTAGLFFCAVLPVCYRDIDVEWQSEHLLHYNPRWIQFLLCRISWEAPVGNVRRACKYHRHFEQLGTRWGNATSQCQCGSCPSEFKKVLSKVLEKLCRSRRTDSGGIAAWSLQNYCSQQGGELQQNIPKSAVLRNL